ncbi:hypothetical protein, variant 2 [Capsaspora owczarzaki ATCC 30864]|nr:hypothetical protein, variant 1 [Capsaspora owczarzaki ATCC 30864]KJE88708.1 hypothetical protein, variant 2 [Capsaspora owczarzaki ATCC 30864]
MPDASGRDSDWFVQKLPFVNRHESLTAVVSRLASKSNTRKGILLSLPQMFGSGKTSFVEHIGNGRNPHAAEILESAREGAKPLYESVLNARYILIDMTHFNRLSEMYADCLEAIFLNTCSTLGLPPLAVPRGPLLDLVIETLQKHAGVPLLLHFDEMGAIENAKFDPWFPGPEYRCSSQPNVFAPDTGALRRHYTFWSDFLAPLLNLDNVYIVCSGKSVAFNLIRFGLLRPSNDAPVVPVAVVQSAVMHSPSELQSIILPPLGSNHIEEILTRHHPRSSSPTLLVDALGLGGDEHRSQRLAFTERVHALTAGVPRLVAFALQVLWTSGIDFGAMTSDQIRAYFALRTTHASITQVFLQHSLELTDTISRPHDPLYLASANIVRRALAGDEFDPRSTISVSVPGRRESVQVPALLLLDRLFCYTKPVGSGQLQVIVPQIAGSQKELALASLVIEFAGPVVTSQTLEGLAVWAIFAALHRAALGDASRGWLLAQSKDVLPQAVLNSTVVQHILRASAPHQGIGFDESTLHTHAGSFTVSVGKVNSSKRRGIDADALPGLLVAQLVELRKAIPTGPIAVVEWMGKASHSSDGLIAVCTAATPTVQDTLWIGVACKHFNRLNEARTGPVVVNSDIEKLSRHFAHLAESERPHQLLITVLSRPPDYLKPFMNGRLLEGRVSVPAPRKKTEVIAIPAKMQVAMWDLDTLNSVVDPSRKLTFSDEA